MTAHFESRASVNTRARFVGGVYISCLDGRSWSHTSLQRSLCQDLCFGMWRRHSDFEPAVLWTHVCWRRSPTLLLFNGLWNTLLSAWRPRSPDYAILLAAFQCVLPPHHLSMSTVFRISALVTSRFHDSGVIFPWKAKAPLFKNSVRTSKRTPHFTITKINWLTLFKEIIVN
jgi:hypothetical protein